MSFSFQRPVAGYVNFCPSSITDREGDDDYIMTLAKHEILHTLVSKLSLEYWSNIYIHTYIYRYIYIYSMQRIGQENPCSLQTFESKQGTYRLSRKYLRKLISRVVRNVKLNFW